MGENTILDVWSKVYPSLADCILLILSLGIFFWFRSSIKGAIQQFTDSLKINALSVKEHLDNYNEAHEKSWFALSELVQELKSGKVWQKEYELQIKNLEFVNVALLDKIKDLDERLKCIERERRLEDKG